MDYLLSSTKIPFLGKSKANNDPEQLDISLSKARAETTSARQNLQDLINDEENNSVRFILNESGLPKTQFSKKFDYDEADKKIRQRELDQQHRKEELAKRLKEKEDQLFGIHTNKTVKQARRADKKGYDHFVADDMVSDDDVESIDATMRKHIQGQSQGETKKQEVIVSPLPHSPPKNIKLWKEKLKSTKYELPTQEEERLEKELNKIISPKLGQSHTRDIPESAKVIKTVGDTDKLKALEQQLEKLRLENLRFKCNADKAEREGDYWKHRFEALQHEKDDLVKENDHLNYKLTNVLTENKKLFHHVRKTDKELRLLHSQLAPTPQSTRYDTDHMTGAKADSATKNVHNRNYDIDDTTQLLKFASDSIEHKLILK